MGTLVLESDILSHNSQRDDGHALLTDFGFSHLANNASFSLAVEQHPGGTRDWISPEYLEEDPCAATHCRRCVVFWNDGADGQSNILWLLH